MQRMQQVFMKGTGVVVESVPPPSLVPGHVLVATRFSCISVGTEMAGVSQSSMPVWRRALAERSRITQVVNLAKSIGVKETINFVQSRLSTMRPLGYSLSGRVVGIGAGVTHVAEGDLVACGGAQCANHAEVVAVPANLAVAAPPGISERDASMSTVGAIALQGVRRANPTIGETFVVIGLGLIGLLTVQILKANGCVVIGTDLNDKRVKLARELGADVAFVPSNADDLSVLEHSHGYGADGVIITAGTKSDEIMSTAFRLTRKKGRVVIVGDVGLSLNRADFYAKEIDVLISSSYGPGRYDRVYEEAGLDYPLPFVRWTEGRNMECFMELVAQKRVSVDALQPVTFPLEQAAAAYAALSDSESAPISVFLSYTPRADAPARPKDTGSTRAQVAVAASKVRLAIIGAGSFASAIHLPNIKKLRGQVEVVAVGGRTGYRVAQVATELGGAFASTDIDAILDRSDVDAVLISTRHDSHAALTRAALERGKHVFVEKPTVITRGELDALDALLERLGGEGRLPVLMTGYNRRFSSFSSRARELVRRRSCPLVQTYRMAAGQLPRDHWTKGPEGGGRNIGEACHIYDLFGSLVSSPVKDVTAMPLGRPDGAYQVTDNFVTTIRYEDGSIATLTYTAQGSPKLDKERWEIFSERTAIVVENWSAMTVHGTNTDKSSLVTQDKGFEQELGAFVGAITGSRVWPISWEEQKDTATVALLSQEQLVRGGARECVA